MKLNLIKSAMIAAAGVFIVNGEANANVIAKTPSPKEKQTKTKKVVTPTKKVVPSSRVTYKKSSPIIKAVRSVPPKTVVIKHKGLSFYNHNGLFYRKEPNRYVAIPAPIGLRIAALPLGYTLVKLLNQSYYYYQGTYYRQYRNEYEVVAAPQDIIVSALPEEADQITLDGKDYYLYNGDLYAIVITPNGKAFQMVGNLEIN